MRYTEADPSLTPGPVPAGQQKGITSMRLGLTEIVLVLFIILVIFGPGIYSWASRYARRFRAQQAEEARRRAAWEAERRARRDFILHRFQIAAAVFAVLMAAGLVYTLGFRPIDAQPQSYALPAAQAPQGGQTAAETVSLPLEGYQSPDCMVRQDGWLYLAARPLEGEGSALLRMREDGTGLTVVLTEQGTITSFAFDGEGDIWYTRLTREGGALCQASHDDWGAATQQVVNQIDGRALSYPAAVAVDQEGRVYFTEAARQGTRSGTLEDVLRAELIGHTATGWVYVYDPAARTVQRVLGGVAGASGLALSPEGDTLYVADLASRCIWAVDSDSRELTAGGKGCTLFAGDLPGYPGALTTDEEGSVYAAYAWDQSDWLENRADDPGFREVAARLPRSVQQRLFRRCPTAAQGFDPEGQLEATYGSSDVTGWAAAASGNRLYLPGTDSNVCYFRF